MSRHSNFHLLIIRLIAFALVMPTLNGCFILDVVPTETTIKKIVGGNPSELPPATPILPEPGQMSARRLMRRLAIDLTGQLPSQADLEALSTDPSRYSEIANRLIDSPVAAENIAALHRRMWGLRSDTLPDLERLAQTDPVLATNLTPKIRDLITQAPLQHIRHNYEMQLPFRNVFTASYSFATDELLSFWQVDATGSTKPGDIWSTYANGGTGSDGRPSGGILTEHAMNATFYGRSLASKQTRAYAVLERFTCSSMPNRRAHLLYELKGSDFSAGVHNFALTKRECASCHRPIDSAAGALKEIATGETFADWISYTPPANEFTGFYNGLAVTGSLAWIEAFSNDRRVARCEAQKLAEALNQRRYGILDTTTTSIGLAAYNEGNESLRELVRAIIFSKEYQNGPVTTEIKGDHERGSSGVRILRRHQWRSILISLSPNMASHEFSEALDPGADEFVDHRDLIPSGTYWHNVDRIARIAAGEIVAAELSDSSVAMERRLFTNLPDGSGYGASASVIYKQIEMLWERFTGETIAESATTYTDLQSLWQASAPNESEEDFRRAWRVVLTAILTHPKFITY